jgi:hypothetical protein
MTRQTTAKVRSTGSLLGLSAYTGTDCRVIFTHQRLTTEDTEGTEEKFQIHPCPLLLRGSTFFMAQ